MSFQAVTWAIEQKTGSPSAKAVLWSIANYANENWFAWPKQDTIAADSEQSTDSVGKRIADLIGMGKVRRIKLKRFGRRTHDFLILPPSPYFASDIEALRPFLPSSCDVIEDQDAAAADSGSDKNDSVPQASEDSSSHAAADCGSAENSTLPQSAVDATALVREPNMESVINPDSLPQTPSGPQSGTLDETGLKEFRDTYPRPSSKPDADAALWRAFSEQHRQQALHGARGARRIFEKNPKSSGVVGPTRYLQSEPLWAEYGRFAPAVKAPPPPRVFVVVGSEEWRARAVLSAIIGEEMPRTRRDPAHGEGADFLGHLPPGGLALAQFTDEFGNPHPEKWAIIDRDKNREQVGAWRERVRECVGRPIDLRHIDLGGFVEHQAMGKTYKIPRRVLGLRVPQPFPPAKGSTGPPASAA